MKIHGQDTAEEHLNFDNNNKIGINQRKRNTNIGINTNIQAIIITTFSGGKTKGGRVMGWGGGGGGNGGGEGGWWRGGAGVYGADFRRLSISKNKTHRNYNLIINLNHQAKHAVT